MWEDRKEWPRYDKRYAQRATGEVDSNCPYQLASSAPWERFVMTE